MVGPQFFAEVVSDRFSLHSLITFLGCVFFPPKLWLISTEEKLHVTVVSQSLLHYTGRNKWLKLSSSLFLALQGPNLPSTPQTALGRLVHPAVGPAAASPEEPARFLLLGHKQCPLLLQECAHTGFLQGSNLQILVIYCTSKPCC